MKKLKLLLLMALVFVVILSGCSNQTDSQEQDTAVNNPKEVIRVATSGTYYPFAFQKDGELKGFEVDFWEEFSKRTGKEVEWVLTDFSGLFGLLESDKTDVISAQLTPTEKRKEKYYFTDAYNYSGTNIVLREDDTSVKSLDDLVGKKVGIGTGAVANDIVKEKYPNKEIEIVNYSSAALKGNYQDLEMGRLDAVIAQDVEALIAIKDEGLKLRLVENPIQSGPAAFPVPKNETGKALAEEINKVIAEMHSDGTLTKISEKWLGKDITKQVK
ncbi:MAG: transporter substrate-binding domain-containing protein [Anaeromicrobium sp.]|jgi:putative amino-acid transport system substrate-binding protein|uniref:transporter substrate-binding domain-containing protein n=1 Tax=Anaeromicrobium sp. TaxID=1929132 RepID=UPI0025E1739F|nr:transporter substrate-binding domain-containing protein [Anaeromicrobium sp.]MCT4592939.1 transporter substrate-binding domain-containing protein [Anaeromicrobium sp.]